MGYVSLYLLLNVAAFMHNYQLHHKQAPFLATYSSASLHTASTSQVATCMQEIGEREAAEPFPLSVSVKFEYSPLARKCAVCSAV